MSSFIEVGGAVVQGEGGGRGGDSPEYDLQLLKGVSNFLPYGGKFAVDLEIIFH
jgi:hypothetical protein